VPIDIFDTERRAPDRVFRYPIYERFLWLVVLAVAVLVAVFRRHVWDFLASEGQRGLLVLGVVALFLLITVWISFRAWVSKVVISPVSLKATVFGQGVQRISWVHIQEVVYKWRPFGHKLVFIGSDGARISFRSSIQGYDELLGYIRESAPEPVRDQLEDIFGEEKASEEEEEPAGVEPQPEPAPAPDVEEEELEEEAPPPAPATQIIAPVEPAGTPEPAKAEPEAAPPEGTETIEPEGQPRKWWWVFIGR